MLERLKNCPQCGGTLNEAGRCEFCGSKVYDFLTIDFNNREYGTSAKTYIRVKYNGKIVIAPVVVSSMQMDIQNSFSPSYFDRENSYVSRIAYPVYHIDFDVIGDMIEVKE
jgi:hypothetical protein